MRLKRYLQEKYIGMDKYNKNDIYENPGPNDFNMVISNADPDYKRIRFIADILSKKVWIASDEIIHSWMWNGCVKKHAKSKDANSTTMLVGIADKKGGKWTMVASDSQGFGYKTREIKIVKEIFSHDWKWVNKYIKVDKWIKDLKKERNL